MAVDATLVAQLMTLSERERREIADLLLSTIDGEDDLDDVERARLHASLERSVDDIAHGRVRDARVVIDELRARKP